MATIVTTSSLGRCDYRIKLPHVSKEHIKFFVHTSDDQRTLVSCEDTSRHGILWNGVHLKRGEAVVLNDGDQIRLLGRNTPALEYRSGEHPFTDKKKGEAVLGRYIVHSRILGTGGFAAVFLAHDTETHRQLACKVQDLAMLKRSSISTRQLRQEIALLKKISHPNINKIHDKIQSKERLYIFCTLATGGDLFELLQIRAVFPHLETKFVLMQIVEALQHIHSLEIAHRDIKPENILVISSPDSYPHVQLADFGMAFASANQETERVDQAGERQHIPRGRSASVGGTVHYLSPDALLAKTKHTCYDPFAILLTFNVLDSNEDIEAFLLEEALARKLISAEQYQMQRAWWLQSATASSISNASDAAQSREKRQILARIFDVSFLAEIDDAGARQAMARLNEVNSERRIKAGDIADLTWFAKDKETLDAVYRARVLKHDVAAADLDEELR
ncbi:kinase-like protein [Acaromyces ingoldii]|uniref:Kinase-like protein n=1 Tax=Acaromyces ingoldii TaxID=215250 RepID=A0A316YKD7_9BASI|nr:kinase-like protein [Acaromyces ingoldii]PWN89679.1 kinase-like protein [Acaromyces ingoldii]